MFVLRDYVFYCVKDVFGHLGRSLGEGKVIFGEGKA